MANRLFRELVHTHAFRRLRSVRFLGAIDYLLVRNPNGAQGNVRHTRYQHSIGVPKLAALYGQAVDLSEDERNLLTAAALLHDLGHAPLSHSLEPVFFEVFGIEHHSATEKIIVGQSPLGSEIRDILNQYKINIDRLLQIVRGEDARFHGFMSGPINFDTIEGILRSQMYFRGQPNTLAPQAVMASALTRYNQADRAVVDRFWETKGTVYKHLINSEVGVLADVACKRVMKQSIKAIEPEDYYSTEENIFNKLPSLRPLLTSPDFPQHFAEQFSQAVPYRVRHFYIDEGVDFFSRLDHKRYRQTKHQSELHPRRDPPSEGTNLDLFDGSY